MDLGLEGRKALVTGSSSGIGEATAKVLAEAGVLVAIHGRDRSRAERVAQEIRSTGGQAVVAIGDLADDEGAERVADVVDAEFGGIDILFNNAGGGGRSGRSASSSFLDLCPEDWLGQYQHNVISAVRMIQRFVPGMKERGWGRIIQNASGIATTPREMENDYAAAKAAVVNLTVGLAKALAGTGITVNTVSPGLILTDKVRTSPNTFLQAFARAQGWDPTLPNEELERRWAKARGLPTSRAGRADDIAAMVALLASPRGGYVNGANIRIDGGLNQAIN